MTFVSFFLFLMISSFRYYLFTAHVEFDSKESAEAAVKRNGAEFNGATVVISSSKPRSTKINSGGKKLEHVTKLVRVNGCGSMSTANIRTHFSGFGKILNMERTHASGKLRTCYVCLHS